jgi:hypothetical protein
MKYKLTDEKLSWYGRKLYRIQALKDFGYVKAGDFGGWVESESNLSQEGDCWIYDNEPLSDLYWDKVLTPLQDLIRELQCNTP